MADQKEAVARQLFDVLDTDGDDRLTRDDLIRFIPEDDQDGSEKLNRLVALLDPKNTGFITFSYFLESFESFYGSIDDEAMMDSVDDDDEDVDVDVDVDDTTDAPTRTRAKTTIEEDKDARMKRIKEKRAFRNTLSLKHGLNLNELRVQMQQRRVSFNGESPSIKIQPSPLMSSSQPPPMTLTSGPPKLTIASFGKNKLGANGTLKAGATGTLRRPSNTTIKGDVVDASQGAFAGTGMGTAMGSKSKASLASMMAGNKTKKVPGKVGTARYSHATLARGTKIQKILEWVAASDKSGNKVTAEEMCATMQYLTRALTDEEKARITKVLNREAVKGVDNVVFQQIVRDVMMEEEERKAQSADRQEFDENSFVEHFIRSLERRIQGSGPGTPNNEEVVQVKQEELLDTKHQLKNLMIANENVAKRAELATDIVHRLEAENATLTSTITSLRDENRILRERCNEMERGMRVNQDALDVVQKEHATCIEHKRKQQEEIDRLLADVTDARTMMQNLLSEVEQLRTANEALTAAKSASARDALRSRMETMNQIVEQRRKLQENRIFELESEVRRLHGHIESLDADCVEYQRLLSTQQHTPRKRVASQDTGETLAGITDDDAPTTRIQKSLSISSSTTSIEGLDSHRSEYDMPLSPTGSIIQHSPTTSTPRSISSISSMSPLNSPTSSTELPINRLQLFGGAGDVTAKKEFFYLTCLVVKMNHTLREDVCAVNTQELFEKAIAADIDFYNYAAWIEKELTKLYLESTRKERMNRLQSPPSQASSSWLSHRRQIVQRLHQRHIHEKEKKEKAKAEAAPPKH